MSKALLSLNPFEVREVLQGFTVTPIRNGESLNPFEVREVLQAILHGVAGKRLALNPFEVREVLQGQLREHSRVTGLSIPLKSGKCCKHAWFYCQSRGGLSIPLKSGKCCKGQIQDYALVQSSQSL